MDPLIKSSAAPVKFFRDANLDPTCAEFCVIGIIGAIDGSLAPIRSGTANEHSARILHATTLRVRAVFFRKPPFCVGLSVVGAVGIESTTSPV